MPAWKAALAIVNRRGGNALAGIERADVSCYYLRHEKHRGSNSAFAVWRSVRLQSAERYGGTADGADATAGRGRVRGGRIRRPGARGGALRRTGDLAECGRPRNHGHAAYDRDRRVEGRPRGRAAVPDQTARP